MPFETALREFYKEYYDSEIFFRDGNFIVFQLLRGDNSSYNIYIRELFIKSKDRRHLFVKQFVDTFVREVGITGDILTGAVDVSRPEGLRVSKMLEYYSMEEVYEMDDGRMMYAKEIYNG